MGLISHHFHKFHEYSIIPIINLERKWASIYDLFTSVNKQKGKKKRNEEKKRKVTGQVKIWNIQFENDEERNMIETIHG